MLPGIDMVLGGTKYLVPPLSLGALEIHQKRLAEFTGDLNTANISIVLDVGLSAIKRNYPDMTREQLAEIVDVANMGEVMANVMDVSGLRRKAADAEKAMAGNPQS